MLSCNCYHFITHLWHKMVVGLFLLIVFSGQAVPVFAADFPAPVGYVNDFADVLSSETKQTLEQQLAQLEEDSSIELAVVTVESLGGITIDDYAVRLFEAWEIGKKNEDNGALLLIAVDERKWRIEPGYGLEPLLTDSKAGRIGRNILETNFGGGDFDTGIAEGVAAIIKVVHGEDVPATFADVAGEEGGGGVWVLFFIGTIFLSYLSSFLSRSKRWWPGGIVGAILGVILGIFLASIVTSILAAIGLGILGLLFDLVLSKNYKKRKAGDLPTSWWSSGGGFFGGGGSGSSGGSFGGFSGGRSGGGGARGSW